MSPNRALLVLALVFLTASQPDTQTLSGAKPAKSRMAIAGLSSSARHCVADQGANVHDLGWVPENSQIVVTFVSDFDPVAAVTFTQLGSGAPENLARVTFAADDDSGGNLEPELRIRSTFPGTAVLHVKRYSGEGLGCYFYKAEVQVP